MQLRWSHAVLNVRDIDSMIDFYTKILGFRISDRGPLAGDGSPEIVFMSQVPTDHHQLAFVGAGRDDNPPNSVNHFAFRVESLDDVKEMKARLDDDGRAQNIRPLTHGNAWSVYFTDPEGNGIEVFCDSPWHVAQPQVGTWNSDASNEEIEAQTRRDFEKEPQFGSIDAFYEALRSEFE